ncbi:hypothetical protein GJS40_13965 [Aliibacillus thermotolerans]|nr:hypothetical protein [Aliibacillus thermotolerans]
MERGGRSVRKEWKKDEQAKFLLKIGELLEQGYPLEEALQLFTWEEREEVKNKIANMQENLRSGKKFHEVLSTYRFPADVSAYIYFSEQYGSLATGLQGAGQLYMKRIIMFRQLRRMLRYPMILLWILLFVSIVMLQFLFPQFHELFSSLHIEIPLFTKFMLQVYRYSPFIMIVLFTLFLVLFYYYFHHFRHYTASEQMKKLYRLPYLSTFISMFLTYYFSIQLSSMLKGGLSIYKAFVVFKTQHHFPFFQEEGKEISAQLEQGIPLYEVLDNREWYRREMKHVIQHGQAAGKLGDDLYHYSERVFSSLEEKVQRFLLTLQPTLFTFIGLLVLSMFLSVFLPMFQLMTTL